VTQEGSCSPLEALNCPIVILVDVGRAAAAHTPLALFRIAWTFVDAIGYTIAVAVLLRFSATTEARRQLIAIIRAGVVAVGN